MIKLIGLSLLAGAMLLWLTLHVAEAIARHIYNTEQGARP